MIPGATPIFVAHEGFELIPNAIHDMKDPQRDLKRGIVWSILVTIPIYVSVSTVAVGILLPAETGRYKEYALAVAARPFLGRAGFLLIGLAAPLSTASAINAMLFGTARLRLIVARDRALPRIFGMTARSHAVLRVGLTAITVVTPVLAVVDWSARLRAGRARTGPTRPRPGCSRRWLPGWR